MFFFEKPISKQMVLSKKWQKANKMNIYFQANHKQELYLSSKGLVEKIDSVLNLQSNKNYVWLYANQRYVYAIGPGRKTTKRYFKDTCNILEKVFGRKIHKDYESRYTEKFNFGDETLKEFCQRNEIAYHWNHNCDNWNLVGNAGLQFDCPECGNSRMMTPEELVVTLCKDRCFRYVEPVNHEQVYSLKEAKTALKEQGKSQ